jgi:hypothetical protein
MDSGTGITGGESGFAALLTHAGGPLYGMELCVFITAGPMVKMFTGGVGGEWRTCAMRDDRTRIGDLKENWFLLFSN